MAVTATLYNDGAKRLANKEVELTTLKLMLLDATAAFDGANTQLSQVAGAGNSKEVSGNGWTVGGETLQNVAVTVINTNDAKLDGDDVSKTASGGNIGPAPVAVIYDDTDANDAPLIWIDLDGAKEAGVGTPFNVNWHADGIVKFTTP